MKELVNLAFRLLLPEILSQIDRIEVKSAIFDLFSPVAPHHL